MRRASRSTRGVLMFAVALLGLFPSCNRKTIYNHYEHTPIVGWEKNDTLTFDVSPVRDSGIYYEELRLRTNGQYPFKGLSLVVEQTVLPLAYTHHDTLSCTLVDDNSNVKGKGVTSYQYNFHLTNLRLNKGDSLHICVRHNMKREILRGVADVGLLLRKHAPLEPESPGALGND